MTQTLRYAATVALGAMAVGLSASASAETVEAFYKARPLQLFIGFGPGGGYDRYSRTLARHMSKYIPGKPEIVSRNMPGAGSLIVANFLYNTAPKDGSAFGIFASSTLFSKLVGEKRAKFELKGYTWIGNIDQTVGTCSMWHKSGRTSFDEIRKKGAVFGSTGPTGVGSTFARGLNALLGTKIRIITGYPGSASIVLAMKRGEVHGACSFALSSLKSSWYRDWQEKKIVTVLQTAIKKSPDLPGVPHVYDFAKSDDNKRVMNLIYGPHILGRTFAAPPGIPADRAKALRDAFAATMKDKDFLADAKKQRLSVDPMGPEEIGKVIDDFTSYSPAVYQRAATVLNFGTLEKVKFKSLAATIATLEKRQMSVKGKDGKVVKLKLHPRRTRLKIAGKKAKITALKSGMACTFKYVGEGDLARQVDCK